MVSSPCKALLFILSYIIIDELRKILYIFNLFLNFFYQFKQSKQTIFISSDFIS